MSGDYAALSHLPLRAGTPCHTPSGLAPLAHIDDPATTVMTDFKKETPVTIEPHTGIEAALEKMKTSGVRLLLVTNERDNIDGIITSYDIQGERPIQLMEEQRISRSDIHVDLIMTPLDKVEAMDMLTVNGARVGHIIETMRALQKYHTLVVEVDKVTHQYTIRGIFSASRISRLLGRDITQPEFALDTLAEVQRKIG